MFDYMGNKIEDPRRSRNQDQMKIEKNTQSNEGRVPILDVNAAYLRIGE